MNEGPAPEFPIAKADFLKVAHMVMCSIEWLVEPEGNNVPDDFPGAVVKQIDHAGVVVMNNMARCVF